MTAAELERETDAKHFVKMALHYRRLCKEYPGLKRCVNAREAAAIAFNVPVETLIAPGKQRVLVELRHKAMAATRALSKATLDAVGEVYARHHSTVDLAERKYAEAVRRALVAAGLWS